MNNAVCVVLWIMINRCTYIHWRVINWYSRPRTTPTKEFYERLLTDQELHSFERQKFHVKTVTCVAGLLMT